MKRKFLEDLGLEKEAIDKARDNADNAYEDNKKAIE